MLKCCFEYCCLEVPLLSRCMGLSVSILYLRVVLVRRGVLSSGTALIEVCLLSFWEYCLGGVFYYLE